jgi:hypothetical protein
MIPQPLIAVNDVQATSNWFQKTLGFTSGHGGSEYEQLFSNGQMVLQLHKWDAHEHPYFGMPDSKPYGNGVVLWFFEEKIEQAFAAAVLAGAKILLPLEVNQNANHLEFWLSDPNGYVVVVAGPYGQLGAFKK